MTFTEFGKVAVVTPGTKVQVTLPNPINGRPDRCHRLTFTQVKGQTGSVYLYGTNATGTPVLIREFLPPTPTGLLDSKSYGGDGCEGGNPVQPSQFWIDADNAGEGLEVVAEVA